MMKTELKHIAAAVMLGAGLLAADAERPVETISQDIPEASAAPQDNDMQKPKVARGRHEVMPRPVRTISITHCDSILLPFAVAGLVQEGERIMSAPLTEIDSVALANLVSAAGLIAKEAPEVDSLLQRAETVRRAAAVHKAFASYFEDSLYAPSEAYSMNRLLQFPHDGLTDLQSNTLKEDGDRLGGYDVATMYFLYVTESVGSNPEIADMMKIKGNPALVRVMVRNVLESDINRPRVEDISVYPALKRRLDEYVGAIENSDTERAETIRGEVDSAMNAPQALPI